MLYHLRLVNNAPKAVLLVTRDPLSKVVRVESGPIIDFKKKIKSVPPEVRVFYNLNTNNFFLTEV